MLKPHVVWRWLRPITDDADIRDTLDHAIDVSFA